MPYLASGPKAVVLGKDMCFSGCAGQHRPFSLSPDPYRGKLSLSPSATSVPAPFHPATPLCQYALLRSAADGGSRLPSPAPLERNGTYTREGRQNAGGSTQSPTTPGQARRNGQGRYEDLNADVAEVPIACG